MADCCILRKSWNKYFRIRNNQHATPLDLFQRRIAFLQDGIFIFTILPGGNKTIRDLTYLTVYYFNQTS